MDAAPLPFVDPHVHADSRSVEEFPRLAAAGCVGLLALSGPGGGYRSPDSLLDHFRRLDRVDRPRIEAAGLRAWIGVGIHPAGIPENDLDGMLEAWPEALAEYRAAAVGEVGLERGGEREERVLARAFAVAAAAGLPLVLHTPRRDKRRLLERALELLAASACPPQRVLADHLDADTLEPARAAGCWLGLSVHPAKLGPAAAADLVERYGIERLLIDSDMGVNPSHLFALPATISALRDRGLGEPDIRAVVCDHAAALIGAQL